MLISYVNNVNWFFNYANNVEISYFNSVQEFAKIKSWQLLFYLIDMLAQSIKVS